MEVIIRQAMPQDFERCIELQKQAGLLTAKGEVFEPEWLAEYLHDGLFLAAEAEGRVCGYILGEKIRLQGAYVWLLAVDRNIRHAGIGTRLLAAFEDLCRSNGITWVIAYSALTESTLGFYKKNGFSFGDDFREILKHL